MIPCFVFLLSCIAVIVLIFAYRSYRPAGGHRVSVRLIQIPTTDADPQEAFEIEVNNRGLPLTGLRVELHESHSFGPSMLTGMHGCEMKPTGKPSPDLGPGQGAGFVLPVRELDQPTLLTTAEKRQSDYCLRALKPNEVAMLVYHSGDRLLKKAIFKRRTPVQRGRLER